MSKSKTLAILGAGHLGRQIAHIAVTDNHFNKIVFYDDFHVGETIDDVKVIDKIEKALEGFKNNLFHEVIIGIGYKHLKKRKIIYDKFKNLLPFATIIHSSCWKDVTSIVKKGSVVYPGCILDINSVVSENCILNLSCTIAHDSVLCSHSFLSPSVSVAGFVSIGSCCFIGINSTVLDNVKITSHVIVGGGAVIIEDINKSGTYVGVPGKRT